MALRLIIIINAMFILIVISSFGHLAESMPQRVKGDVSVNLMDYLTQFGYLPESDRETGNLRTDEQLKEAIRNLQGFAGIPRTGKLDGRTMNLMRRPRCGVADPQWGGRRQRRYAVHGQKWSYTNLTWSLRTRYANGLDHGRTRYDLYKALSVWSDHSKLTFREINSDNADILIYFEKGYHGDGYPFDGKGQVLAHAFFPGSGRGGDVHFDIEEHWQLTGDGENNGERTSLLSVAAHEFGHSLGLAHSSVPGALMYPWYQGFGIVELHDDDKLAIQQLYGAREKQWGKNVGYRPDHRWPTMKPPTRPPTTTTTTTTTEAPRPTHRPYPTPAPHPQIPDTCNTSYDAISIIRREIFIFKGKYTWRVGDEGLHRGYPALAERLWKDLPSDFKQIDAVYERLDKKIVFFIGKYYYVFQGNFLEIGYPKPLAHLGLPPSLHKIDAAMIWSHNSKTYLFSGTMYWKLDEEAGVVELDYPRDIQSVWKGIGYNIDTAFQWKDGSTYFFKGPYFWKFNDKLMEIEDKSPRRSAEFWMRCPPDPNKPALPNDIPTDIPVTSDEDVSDEDIDDDSGAYLSKPSYVFVFLILMCRHFS